MKEIKEKLKKGSDSGVGISGLTTAFITGAAAGLAAGVLITSYKKGNLK